LKIKLRKINKNKENILIFKIFILRLKKIYYRENFTYYDLIVFLILGEAKNSKE